MYELLLVQDTIQDYIVFQSSNAVVFFFVSSRYLKEFRTEQCPLFVQHKCTQHRPFTCFHWHFLNQRRRRPIRRRDGTFNYSPDIYCTKYDEGTGTCPDGDEWVKLRFQCCRMFVFKTTQPTYFKTLKRKWYCYFCTELHNYSGLFGKLIVVTLTHLWKIVTIECCNEYSVC